MAKEIIPDKICPHCGGNAWYVRSVNGKINYECLVNRTTIRNKWRVANKDKMNAAIKNWRKNNSEKVRQYASKNYTAQATSLGDVYIRNLIKSTTNRDSRRHGNNTVITNLDITPEQITRKREILKIQQFIRKEKNMHKKLTVTTKEMSRKEKQDLYHQRWVERKKLGLVPSSSSSSAVLTEEVMIGLKAEIEPKGIIIKSEPVEDIVTEFTRIEARRQEILIQVEQLNNYLESLKIKLS